MLENNYNNYISGFKAESESQAKMIAETGENSLKAIEFMKAVVLKTIYNETNDLIERFKTITPNDTQNQEGDADQLIDAELGTHNEDQNNKQEDGKDE